MARTHLSIEERKLIKTLLDSGQNGSQIAKVLGRNNSSIYNEIRRGTHNGTYDPEYSYALYKENLSKKGVAPILSQNKKLASYISNRILKDGMSPEQVVEVLQEQQDPSLSPVNKNTIYSAIDKGLIPGVTRETLSHSVTKIYSRGCIMLPSWIRKKYDYVDGTVLQIVDNGNGEICLKPIKNGSKESAGVNAEDE